MSFVALFQGGPFDGQERAYPARPGESVLRFPALPAPPPWPPASPDEQVVTAEVLYDRVGVHARRAGVVVYRYREAARHG